MTETLTLEAPGDEHEQDEPVVPVDARRFRPITFGMVSLTILIAYQSLAVTTAMPTVADALNGLSLYAMAFAAPMATGVIGMVTAGLWCDRWGPAGPLGAGVALFIIGMLLVGFAPRMEIVVLGRAIHGLGAGLLLVSLYVVIGRAYPESLRPGVFVAMSAAWVVPSIVGPTIAGLTVQHFDWRWVFLSMPILALPAAFLVRPALRMLDEHAPDPDWNQRAALVKIGWSVLAALGAAALHYGGERRDILGFALIGAALAGLVLSSPKLLPQGTFRASRGLPTVFILRGLVGAAFIGSEIYLPLLLSRERDFSPAMAGSILTIGGVTWFAGSWFRGRFDTRIEPATFIKAGSLSLLIGIVSVTLLVWERVPVLVGVLGWGFSGLGMGLIYSSLSLLTLQLSPQAEQGKNSSALQVAE
ncbi:MAG: MFS transporter, partial [Thermomicrobiales bacterium]|nr:MFS transporter [Thermomicrobiales bacterium]